MKQTRITDYKPDPANPNRHTERGTRMLEDSVHSVGLGRSIVVDDNGYVIAGNSTLERAVDAGFIKAIEVETDGDTLVVVKRKDLDLLAADDTKARQLSYYDNRTAQTGIDWDPEALLRDLNAEVDLSKMFSQDELDALLMALPGADDWDNALGGLPEGSKEPFQQMTFTLHDTQAERVAEALQRAKTDGAASEVNENSNGNALAYICEAFLNG